MIEFLANLLSGILLPMGISYADILVYLNATSNYLLAILLALIVLIIVLVAAKKVRKGWRWFVRCQSVVAFFVVVVVAVNAVCYGPLQNTLSTYLNAAKVELADDTVAQSLHTIEKIGEDGIVLLKNDNQTLPLAAGKKEINVFGWASTKPYIGGTGSSASSAAAAVDILGALAEAGYAYNQTLIDLYTTYCAERPTADMFGQNLTLPEPPAQIYTDELMEAAKAFSDTAMVVIARGGGENYDLPTDMKSVIDGTYNIVNQVSVTPDIYPYTKVTYQNNGDYDDFEAGESYLELSKTEEDMIARVCAYFDHVILVVNACNPMELGFLDETPQIGAVLLAPAPGVKGFSALGRILDGQVNPSGRTADTYVYDLLDTPSILNIGINAYTNIDDLKTAIAAKDATYQGSAGFVNYVEGIYTGYKFYETAAQEGLIDYDQTVQYPFGYGLSYTTFEKTIEDFKKTEEKITFTVRITNTGAVAGRDVVEIYYTPPYTNGGIEKASVNLIDFAKTSEIAPGRSEKIFFSIPLEDMASYDSDKIKLPTGGYILEAGEYRISVRSDSHTVDDDKTFVLTDDIDYSQSGRASDHAIATNRFDNARGDFAQLSRADGFANYDAVCRTKRSGETYLMSDALRAAVEKNTVVGYDGTLYDDANTPKSTTGAKNDLVLADMTGLPYDDAKWDALIDQMSINEMITLINAGGWKTSEIKSIQKVATSDCDGPAGLNNFITGAYGTTYPSEVLMAQTWSKELAYEIGVSMGSEFAAAKNYGWYGPAMNLHRSAFAGRNFEYYSEDGVLSGLFALAEVNGAAQLGVYPYMKHFVMNDQELGRTAILLTFCSEQAMRENYFKPFEIVVKNFEGTSLAIMTAYNWLGDVACCTDSRLLRDVLRQEWGFQGMVITDYAGSYGYMITDACIRNGNDLMLGYGTYDSNELSKKSPTLTMYMRQACKNILYTIANSGYYTEGQPMATVNHMDEMFQTINKTAITLFIAVELLLIVTQLIRRRQNRAKKTAA